MADRAKKLPTDQITSAPRRILAVASGGGHWLQLMRLRPALEGHKVTYVTTIAGLDAQFGASPCVVIKDASRHEPLHAVRMVFQLAAVIIRVRPQVVISTGAAPGLAALALGKLIGARTIWLDSIANAEKLSMSGELAKRVADLWLTQWPHLATPNGPEFRGAVL